MKTVRNTFALLAACLSFAKKRLQFRHAVILYFMLDFLAGYPGLLPGVNVAAAQGNPTQPQFAHNANGRIMVSEYGKWSLQSANSVAAASATMTLSPSCYIKVGTSNRQVFPIAINVPVTIVDGTLTENVTITAVNAPTANTASSTNPFSCSFTATFANAHNAGVSMYRKNKNPFCQLISVRSTR